MILKENSNSFQENNFFLFKLILTPQFVYFNRFLSCHPKESLSKVPLTPKRPFVPMGDKWDLGSVT
jgi:hypothetical protein